MVKTAVNKGKLLGSFYCGVMSFLEGDVFVIFASLLDE